VVAGTHDASRASARVTQGSPAKPGSALGYLPVRPKAGEEVL
jgi:hypothetical protein